MVEESDSLLGMCDSHAQKKHFGNLHRTIIVCTNVQTSVVKRAFEKKFFLYSLIILDHAPQQGYHPIFV